MQEVLKMEETKICNKCGEVKLKTEFYRRTANKDGLTNSCKSCDRKAKKKYSKQCLTCGNIFETTTNKTRFCSRTCVSYSVSCVNCKKTFYSKMNGSKYCSITCKEEFALVFNEKQCGKCGLVKKIDDFSICRDGVGGKKSQCKECDSKDGRNKKREKKLKEYMEYIGYQEVEKKIPEHFNLEEMKKCTLCLTDKPLTEFHYVASKKNFYSQCKECKRKKDVEYQRIRQIKKIREMKERGKERWSKQQLTEN